MGAGFYQIFPTPGPIPAIQIEIFVCVCVYMCACACTLGQKDCVAFVGVSGSCVNVSLVWWCDVHELACSCCIDKYVDVLLVYWSLGDIVETRWCAKKSLL